MKAKLLKRLCCAVMAVFMLPWAAGFPAYAEGGEIAAEQDSVSGALAALGSFSGLCVGQSVDSIFKADKSREIRLYQGENYLVLRSSDRDIHGLDIKGLDTSKELDAGKFDLSYIYGETEYNISVPYSVEKWKLTLKGGARDVVLTPDENLTIDLSNYYKAFSELDGFIGWQTEGSDEVYTTECVMTEPGMTLIPIIAGMKADPGKDENSYRFSGSYSFSIPLIYNHNNLSTTYPDCRILEIGEDVHYIDTAHFTDVFPNLEEIIVDEGNERYSVRNDVLCMDNTVVMSPTAAEEVIIPEDIDSVWIEAMHGIKAKRIVFNSEEVPEFTGMCEHNSEDTSEIIVPDSADDMVYCRYLADFACKHSVLSERIVTMDGAEQRNILDAQNYAVYGTEEYGVRLKYVASSDNKLFHCYYSPIAVHEDGVREDQSDGISMVIGSDAFSDSPNIIGVVISEDVVGIEDGAFSGIPDLDVVKFESALPPEGYENIPVTDRVTKVLIPEECRGTDNDAWAAIPETGRIYAPTDCSISDDCVVYNENTLVSVPHSFNGILYLNMNIDTIGDDAAKGCDSLNGIAAENSIVSIGDNAFYHCNSLMFFGDEKAVGAVRLSGQSNLEYMGISAFSYCPYIKKVSFPDSLKTISESCFRGCVQLRNVDSWGGIKEIGAKAFYNTGLYAADLSKSNVERINKAAFSDCRCFDTLILSPTLEYIDTDFAERGANIILVAPKAASLSETNFSALRAENAIYSKIYTAPDSDEAIAARLAEEQSDIITEPHEGSYYVPNSFSGIYICNTQGYATPYSLVKAGLKTVDFLMATNDNAGKSTYVTAIEPGAFDGCEKLRSVRINSTVRAIPERMFADKKMLESVELTSVSLPSGESQPKISIGEAAFENCTGLIDFSLSHNVGKVEPGVFRGCSKLKTVFWNADSESIPANAFEGCTSLLRVNIGINAQSALREIGSYAFKDCTSLKYIMGLNDSALFASLESFGEGAFANCLRLSDIWLPYSMRNIGNSAFRGCDGLFTIRVYTTSRSPMAELGEMVFGTKEDLPDSACFDIWTVDEELYNRYLDSWGDKLYDEYEKTAKDMIICSKRMVIPDGSVEIQVNEDFHIAAKNDVITTIIWDNAIKDTELIFAERNETGELLALYTAAVRDIDIMDGSASLEGLEIPIHEDAEYCDLYFWDIGLKKLEPTREKLLISAEDLNIISK